MMCELWYKQIKVKAKGKHILHTSQNTSHSKIQNLSQKQVILPYLENSCACTNQLMPNMDNK